MNKPREALDLSAPRLVWIARCAELLAELRQDTPGLQSATLASPDGLTVASTLPNKADADRLSAMSGSISALAAAMTRETRHGEPQRVVLESAHGHIVSMSVPLDGGSLVLTVVTDSASVLGKLLWNCRQTAERIARSVAET